LAEEEIARMAELRPSGKKFCRLKKSVCLACMFFFLQQAFAGTDKQLWFGYNHFGRVANHWGYWVDIQHRTRNNFAENLNIDIFRFGGSYFIKDNLRITVGYAYAAQFPSPTNQSFVRPEHRPWQQFAYNYIGKNFRATHGLRTEQRFFRKTKGENLISGYDLRLRLRYSYTLSYVFNKKEYKQGSFGGLLNDEVMINAYRTDKSKLFDQNRAYAAFLYHITDALQLQLGYLFIYSFTPQGKEIVHAIRLNAVHNIDWRKKR
jgi:hypothetical protein